jgi:GWxTD domain-containing protein
MRRLACFLVGVSAFLFTAESTAQPLPLQVDLDHGSFAYDADRSLLEVYLAFGAQSLHFVRDDGAFTATLPIELRLLRRARGALPGGPEDPIWADSLNLRFAAPDTTGLGEGQKFIHQMRAAVPPGEYELHVIFRGDEERGVRSLGMRRDVVVPDFTETGLVGISNLTLASFIEPSEDRDSPFFKNGLMVLPNADQVFGMGLSRLYYYGEVYNVDAVLGEEEDYTLLAFVSDAYAPQPLLNFERRIEREVRSPDVVDGSFELSELPSGSYFLRLVVLDGANESVAEQVRKFFVYNPDVRREAPMALGESFETSEYASMTEAEVGQAFEHVHVIASERERRRMRSIRDLDERRVFLMEFWKMRDPNTATSVNEFKEEFYSRLQYANERYSSNRGDGWKTDRGHVVMKYGFPTAVEPHHFDRGMLPHEIWQYNNIPGEGQATFVFADRDGFGEFVTIHATVAGERSLPDWRQELRR